MEIPFFFFFFTPRFTVHEKEENNLFLFFSLSLDELLLMSNYLITIDGALVGNSAAAVQSKEEPDRDWERKSGGSTGLPRPSEPRGAQ